MENLSAITLLEVISVAAELISWQVISIAMTSYALLVIKKGMGCGKKFGLVELGWGA